MIGLRGFAGMGLVGPPARGLGDLGDSSDYYEVVASFGHPSQWAPVPQGVEREREAVSEFATFFSNAMRSLGSFCDLVAAGNSINLMKRTLGKLTSPITVGVAQRHLADAQARHRDVAADPAAVARCRRGVEETIARTQVAVGESNCGAQRAECLDRALGWFAQVAPAEVRNAVCGPCGERRELSLWALIPTPVKVGAAAAVGLYVVVKALR